MCSWLQGLTMATALNSQGSNHPAQVCLSTIVYTFILQVLYVYNKHICVPSTPRPVSVSCSLAEVISGLQTPKLNQSPHGGSSGVCHCTQLLRPCLPH